MPILELNSSQAEPTSWWHCSLRWYLIYPWPGTHTSMSYEQTLALATAGFGLTDAHRPLVADLIEALTLAVLTGIDLEPRDRFFLELRAQLHSDDASQNFPRLAAFHHGNRRRLQTSDQGHISTTVDGAQTRAGSGIFEHLTSMEPK